MQTEARSFALAKSDTKHQKREQERRISRPKPMKNAKRGP